MKCFLTPLGTDRTGLRISKMAKSIESKVQKNQFFTTHVLGNFSPCIQFRMHFGTAVSQTKRIGVGLKNILTHRDYLSFMDDQRYVLLLSFHCHRQRLGNGNKIFNHMLDIHITSSASTCSGDRLPEKGSQCPCSN